MEHKLDLKFESYWLNTEKQGKIDKINVANLEQIERKINKRVKRNIMVLNQTWKYAIESCSRQK